MTQDWVTDVELKTVDWVFLYGDYRVPFFGCSRLLKSSWSPCFPNLVSKTSTVVCRWRVPVLPFVRDVSQ